MKYPGSIASLLFVIASGAPAGAAHGDEIVLPDGMVYGSVSIGGLPVQAIDEVVVLAQVEGVAEPAAAYRMGSNPTAGDRFILSFPHVFDPAGGASPTIQAGQLAKIFVQQGPDRMFIAEVAIPASGDAVELDMGATANSAGLTLQSDPANFCGLGCGAVGLSSFCLMMLGLCSLRTRRRQSRTRVLYMGAAICLLYCGQAPAQSAGQSFELAAGWNTIYLEVNPTPDMADELFANLPIESVWTAVDQRTTVKIPGCNEDVNSANCHRLERAPGRCGSRPSAPRV